MSRSRARFSLALSVVIGLLGATAVPGHAQFVLYDNFSGGPLLDPEKWQGTSAEGNAGQPTEEFVRIIDDGQLRLIFRSYGRNDTDSGTVASRQGLNVRQLGTAGGTGFITGMKARVTVLDVDSQDCTTNVGPTGTRARAQMIGAFFNDGTAGAANDATGSMIAGIQMHRDGNGVNQIAAFVLKCTAADCSANVPISVTGTGTFTTRWDVNTPVVLKVNWLKANHAFNFVANGEVRTLDYTGAVNDAVPPRSDFKRLNVSNTVKHCNGTRKRAFIDVVLEKFQIKRNPPPACVGPGAAQFTCD